MTTAKDLLFIYIYNICICSFIYLLHNIPNIIIKVQFKSILISSIKSHDQTRTIIFFYKKFTRRGGGVKVQQKNVKKYVLTVFLSITTSS